MFDKCWVIIVKEKIHIVILENIFNFLFIYLFIYFSVE